MHYHKSSLLIFWLFFIGLSLSACGTGAEQGQNGPESEHSDSLQVDQPQRPEKVLTGADILVSEELEEIKDKTIGIVANHTSLVKGVHLVDTLHNLGIKIGRIFGPEHGFRGDHDAGAKVSGDTDPTTGIPISSLYGKTKKPTKDMLKGLDAVVFDIQDVGARFYTYISTMSLVMEACAENNIRVIVLDRPNPNGWYVEGPILEAGRESFIGMHQVPVNHGMTIGEYARLVNGEGWLADEVSCVLQVISCKNYDHSMNWADTQLEWVPPSPNLPTEYSAYIYPMLCWFEGVPVSVGRGTDAPFEQIAAPWHQGFHNSWMRDSIDQNETPSTVQLYGLQMEITRFRPRSIPGKATHPKYEGQMCYGGRFTNRVEGKQLFKAGLSLLSNLIEEKDNVKLNESLFKPVFAMLVGTEEVQKQLEAGKDPEEIWQSWQLDLNKFKETRKKYLLYSDFE